MFCSCQPALTHHGDRAVKVQMTNEGREAQVKEQEVIQRKRKAEDDKIWEGTCFPLATTSITIY
jgi:hypothetical protein